MMTPAQLKGYEFKTAGRNAYKADDVDTFLAEVIADYEKMFRENSELIKRINLLATKVESYQQDEADIKQAVLSAQRAADLIVKEAETSVADARSEAEVILAAAKGEADIIKSDAEKQAVADSELVLAIATDKAEDIIAKAKEKAHDILIEANASASDTVGQANRTITSESLHYEMLKKEVAEFRTTILAQYKTHIELISKLPELAVEEAGKSENNSKNKDDTDTAADIETKEISDDTENLDSDSADNINDSASVEIDDEKNTIEFVSSNEAESDEPTADITDDYYEDDLSAEAGETVVKTTLPYDFFEENSTLEFIENNNPGKQTDDENLSELDVFENSVGMEFEEDNSTEKEKNNESDNYSVDVEGIDLSLFDNDSDIQHIDDSIAEISNHTVVDDEDDDDDDDALDFFDAIETIEDDGDDDSNFDNQPRSLFGRWRKK